MCQVTNSVLSHFVELKVKVCMCAWNEVRHT